MKTRILSGVSPLVRAGGRDIKLASGIGFALLSSSLFGTIAPVAKIGYERGAEPLALLGTRFTVSALVLMVILYARPRTRRPRMRGPLVLRLVALGAVALAIQTVPFFAALQVAPAGVVSLVFFSFPLITALIAFAFRLEPARLRTFVALGLGSAGVASIFGIEDIALRGLLLALASALGIAVYFILAGILIQGVPPAVAAAWTTAGAALSLSAAALVSGQSLPPQAVASGVSMGFLTIMAFVALYAAIARIGAPRAAVAQMFEPVVTILLAAIFLGEAITGRIVLGAVMIVSSLPVLSGVGRRRTTPPAPDSL